MTTTNEDARQLTAWWQPILFEHGQWQRVSVGPLSLYLQRTEHQWLLAWEQHDESESQNWVTSESIEAPPDTLVARRYVFKQTPSSVCLRPRLLDRALVVKTNQPVIIPPEENITFYISSPICIAVAAGEEGVELQEVATVRLSDTWFGATTLAGELQYAAKTQARNSKAEVPLRPHRAVTPVTIHNLSETLLEIQKLSIPLPCLAVYGLDDGTLWTDPVSLRHTAGSQLSELRLDDAAAEGERLAEPRMPLQKGGFVRAFASMFTD